MTTSNSDVLKVPLERIRKLLAVANDSRGNEHECASAAAMAAKLMAKHNLEMADVIAEELAKDDSIVGEFIDEPNYDKKVPHWYNILGTCIGQTMDCVCRLQWSTSKGKYKIGFQLLGYREDVEVARWLFNYITIQINRLAEEAWKPKFEAIEEEHGRKPYASERRTFKDNYRYGLVLGITGKIREVYSKEVAKEEIKTSAGTSLVAIKQRRIEEVFNFKPEYSEIKNRSESDAIEEGYRNANRINISRVLTEEEEAEQIAQVKQLEYKA